MSIYVGKASVTKLSLTRGRLVDYSYSNAKIPLMKIAEVACDLIRLVETFRPTRLHRIDRRVLVVEE